MNHIFYTQNNISYAIILAMIDKLKIPKLDCTIIHSVSITPNQGSVRYICSDSLTVKTNQWLPKSWDLFKKKRNELDQLLELSKPFVFYNSNFSNWFCTYLWSHQKCTQKHFIEEGLSAYYTEYEFDSLIKKRFFFNPKFRIRQALIWLKYKGEHTINPFKTYRRIQQASAVYSLYKGAYNHKRVIVINPLFEKEILSVPIEILIVPSALCQENSFLEISEYTKGFNQLLSLLSSLGYKEIGIKFHPRQNPNLEISLKTTSENHPSINLVEIDKTKSIENLIVGNEFTLITDISSIAIYNDMFGKQTYSYHSYLSTQSEKFKHLFLSIPKKLNDILIDVNLLKIT